MAQLVKYFEDNVDYEEGPFVLVWAGGYRIEVELKGHHCPVLPDKSIYILCELHGIRSHKCEDKELMSRSVDWLNQQVEEGNIILDGKAWVAK